MTAAHGSSGSSIVKSYIFDGVWPFHWGNGWRAGKNTGKKERQTFLPGPSSPGNL